MRTNIKDIDLPNFHPWFIPCEKSVEELVKEGIEISKTNWIANSMFGYTILTNEDSSAILKNGKWHNAVKLFSNQNYDGDDVFYKQKTSILITLEGEEHARLKKLVMQAFTPSAVQRMRPFVRESLVNILDRDKNIRSIDIQKKIFDLIPAYTLCNLLGIPENDINKLINWADKVFLNFGLVKPEDMQSLKDVVNKYIEYIANLIEIKKSNISDDLISSLIKAKDGDDSLTEDEIIMLVRVILSSGIDTTRGQLGLTFKILASDKKLWNKIALNRSDLELEVKRTFEIDGVIKQAGRFASEDIEYRGILFPKGTIVFPSISIPNIQEPEQQPLTFGRGIHYCLGASLAVVIVEETMSILSENFPNIEILEGLEYKESHRSSAGLVSIPVTLDKNFDTMKDYEGFV